MNERIRTSLEDNVSVRTIAKWIPDFRNAHFDRFDRDFDVIADLLMDRHARSSCHRSSVNA